jgi:hypothetical protein
MSKNLGTIAILKGWKSFFKILIKFLAPGSGSELRLRIQESKINAGPGPDPDLDPKHWNLRKIKMCVSLLTVTNSLVFQYLGCVLEFVAC